MLPGEKTGCTEGHDGWKPEMRNTWNTACEPGKQLEAEDGDRSGQRSSSAPEGAILQLWPRNLEAVGTCGGIAAKVEECGRKFQRGMAKSNWV